MRHSRCLWCGDLSIVRLSRSLNGRGACVIARPDAICTIGVAASVGAILSVYEPEPSCHKYLRFHRFRLDFSENPNHSRRIWNPRLHLG